MSSNLDKIKKSIYFFCMLSSFLFTSFFGGIFRAENSFEQLLLTELSSVTTSENPVITINETNREKNFYDVERNSWYYPYVTSLTSKGLIKGVSDTEFSPEGQFTIAECAVIISRYLNLEDVAESYQLEYESRQSNNSAWYAGYLHLMVELEVMKSEEIGVKISDGNLTFTDISSAGRPVLRHEFALFISRSFELPKNTISARNVYPETGGRGHEFIVGGAYDRLSYEAYISEIYDYYSIPQESAQGVLKTYYNGIFNGDETGNFNPLNKLTRAEMAKVLSVITDRSMRIRSEYRNLPEQMNINLSDYKTFEGESDRLTKEKGFLLLSNYASLCLFIDSDTEKSYIKYTHLNIAPSSYAIEISINEKNGERYIEKEFLGLTTDGGQNTPSVLELTTDKNQYSILILLRNIEKNNRIEGVLTIYPAQDGTALYSDTTV